MGFENTSPDKLTIAGCAGRCLHNRDNHTGNITILQCFDVYVNLKRARQFFFLRSGVKAFKGLFTWRWGSRLVR